jgi:V/A-type H+-transporting ATPase subunit E
MNDQLQDLLKRIYEEGVAKANAEAEKIINEAKAKADELIAKATAEATNTIASAEKQAADMKKNTESDLSMAANHSLNAVKQKITELILSHTLNAKLGATFNDAEFLKKLIYEALNAWKANSASGTITVSEAMKPMLDDYYLNSLKVLFDNKLQIDFSPTMKHGFSLAPSDGTYKLSFNDEDFANLFKTYLRPRTKELLFGS